MRVFSAFNRGCRYVTANIKWLVLILLIQFIVLLFPGMAMKNAIQQSLEHRQAAEQMLNSWDSNWFAIFSHNAGSLEHTFQPAVNGVGGILEPLNQFFTGNLTRVPPILFGFGVLYLLLWTFFTGGLLSRFQPEKPHRGFFASSAFFFWRILSITILAGIAYYLLFRYVFPGFGNIVESLTRETIDERVHFVYTVIKYLVFWLLVWSVNLVADYAKIHIVRLNLANPFAALGRSLQFVFGHPLKTYSLYFLIGLIWLLGLVIYGLLVPGAAHASSFMILIVLLLGQLYIFWRIAVRAQFLGAQTALVEQTMES